MTTRTAAPQTTTTAATLGTSRYGNPEPRIDVRTPKGASFRAVSVAAHRLAAAIEEASEGERWCVGIEIDSDNHARVYLELSNGTDAEAARGMALLRKIAG